MYGLSACLDKITAYNPHSDIDKIKQAFFLAEKAHQSQKRADGAPYISHPVAVAELLISKHLDDCSIIAALLHDTIEDTDLSEQEIEKNFGEDVLTLVRGITKLSNFGFIRTEAKQAENFRKLLLATSRDIRVLLIKLADRLHNMRTIEHLRDDSRRRIAYETLEIYVPLAQRIGLRDWKEELENIAFGITNPRPYNSIVKRLESLSLQQDRIEEIIARLEALFADKNMPIQITGRQKTPASIWRKLQRKRRFNQLSDIVAFRILLDDVMGCYQVLGHIHEAFQMIPGGFKDYISVPKSNGYQSLHTLVLLPDGQQIEIQIRTFEMHHHAEYGIAAHWQYKQNAPIQMATEGRKYQWIRSLLDILEHATTPEDFLQNTKLDLFNTHVFVFSPQGEIRDLPYGATPIDYAYTIHSDIGNHCISARVNGHVVPIKSRLRNGDQVEIITAKTQTPSVEWLKYVKTGRARTSIRRYLRHANHEEYIRKGRTLLERSYQQVKLKFQDKMLKSALAHFQQDDTDNLLGLVGHGDISPSDILHYLEPDAHKHVAPDKPRSTSEPKKRPAQHYPIAGVDADIPLKLARCCHPLPPDAIVGIVHSGRGITVHKKACRDIAYRFVDDEQNNILPLEWRMDAQDIRFTGRCQLVMDNRPNVLAEVTTVVGKQGLNILHIASRNRNHDSFHCIMDVEIENINQMDNLLHALQSLPMVHDAVRI